MKKYSSSPLSKQAARTLVAMSVAACTFIPAVTQAEETSASDDWKVSTSMYLWAAGVGGNVKNGSEIDVTFNDILSNLDMSFMGNLEARKDKWFVATDLIYISLSDSADGLLRPDAGDIAVKGSFALDQIILTPTVGYNLIDSKKGTLDTFIGVQYVNIDTTVKLSSVGVASSHYKKATETDDVFDGIVGVKGQLNLEGNWYIPYYVDIGSGDSNFTWQTYTGISYHMDQTNIFFGYRYLEWDLGNKVIDNLNLNGPIIGAKYTF